MTRQVEPLPVLTLNSGSSSLKFGFYSVGVNSLETVLTGEAESIGQDRSNFSAFDASGQHVLTQEISIPDQKSAIARIGEFLDQRRLGLPAAVGHRVVHGGPRIRGHTLIDAAVLQQLEAAVALAPLHAPAALAVIKFAQEHFPTVPHVACLDTAFHTTLPDVARLLPIQKALQSEGVYRYGFHGLSCESIIRQLGKDLPERLAIAHLGNGASITAVKNGRSIDTSMGLTPSGGIIMGTRTGDIDPGVLTYLAREKCFDAAALDSFVNRDSGLLGISGVSGDLRKLHEAEGSNPDARLALVMFCYSIRKQIAAMAAALEGVDVLVFTGGIGENDPAVREVVCAGLSWLGVNLDAERNRLSKTVISSEQAKCAVRVIRTKEEEQIARHVCTLMRGI